MPPDLAEVSVPSVISYPAVSITRPRYWMMAAEIVKFVAAVIVATTLFRSPTAYRAVPEIPSSPISH